MHRTLRRLALLALVPVALLATRGDVVADDLPDTFQNLQVLPEDITKDELKGIMRGFTEQLDVQCTFCHVEDEYYKDDNKHKHIARKMIRLVQHLRDDRDTWFPKPRKDAAEKPELLTCWMCHRGSAEVEPFVPEE
jgi:Photosynthetic reaction centre cytochrome C subunit